MEFIEKPQAELAFEDELIDYLQHLGGTKQWEYRPEIKTIPQLWDNFCIDHSHSSNLGAACPRCPPRQGCTKSHPREGSPYHKTRNTIEKSTTNEGGRP